MNRPNLNEKKPKGSRPNRYKDRKAARRTDAPKKRGEALAKVWRTGKFVFSGVFALVLVGVLSVGLVLGYHFLVSSEYFMVRKVVLTGLNRVSRTQVLASTGLDKPANILALNLSEMAEELQAAPWIDRVTLTRKLPDTILVDVKERRPQALISLGAMYYLDESGRAFKKVDPNEKPELPIVTGFTKADLLERFDFTQRDLKEVFALLEVLAERNDLFRLENISEINFDVARGLTLFTREQNIQVKVGFSDYRAKIKRLGRVMAHLKINGQSDGLAYFNLECSPRVVVRHAVSG